MSHIQKTIEISSESDDSVKPFISNKRSRNNNADEKSLTLHPRNKKSGAGSTYDALRIQNLCDDALEDLYDRLTWTVQQDSCWVQTKTTNKQPGGDSNSFGGLVPVTRPRGLQVSRRFSTSKTTFEQVTIVLAYNKRVAPSSEHEVSHLCHNPSCINPAHLEWETHDANMERERCRYTRRLSCPCSYCEYSISNSTATTFNICQHNPPCVPCTCNTSGI